MKSSKQNNFTYESFTDSSLGNFISPREGEHKLGQNLGNASDASFVIIGICEDSGPRANLGNGGSTNAFDAFLGKFLNMQSNQFLQGNEIYIPGRILQQTTTDEVATLRTRIEELDAFVQEIIEEVVLEHQTLIVIGGGHNNAYPIIKSVQSIHNSPHAILNIDPHADCRPLEGRHSGNPFSYALNEGAISSYGVFGLHEQYNSQSILDFLSDQKCPHSFFENYLNGSQVLQDDVNSFLVQNHENPIGIEIDLDCIESMPTSAFTPSGFTVNQIRSIIQSFSSKSIHYLHLPEGAPKTDIEKTIVGKTLAYFVSDFVKTQL